MVRPLVIACALGVAACGVPPAPPAPPASERVMPGLDVPYVGTPPEVVRAMLELARPSPGELLADLGCGDGRIVLAAVAAVPGLRGLGVDRDPRRVDEARVAAERVGLAERVTFRELDLFEARLDEVDVLALYLLPELNVRLRPAIFAQMRPGARVVSHDFDMDTWRWEAARLVPGTERYVFLWVVPARVAGRWRVAVEGEAPFELELAQRFQELDGASVTGPPLGARGRLDGLELDLWLSPPTGPARRLRGRIDQGRLEGALDLVPARAWQLTAGPVGAGVDHLLAPDASGP